MEPEQLTKFYHLTFRVKGIPDPLFYHVPKAESDRLQRILETPEPEREATPHFFFMTTDGRRVIISLRDIQLVSFGWDIGLDIPNLTAAHTDADEAAPQIEIYFRESFSPYQGTMDDPLDLESAFIAGTFDFAAQSFIYFIDEDGEETYLRPDDAVVIAYWWEEDKRNFSLVHTIEGRSPENDHIIGFWRIYAWQSERGVEWYAETEFVIGDYAYTLRYETFGPAASKTEAVEGAIHHLESEAFIHSDYDPDVLNETDDGSSLF